MQLKTRGKVKSGYHTGKCVKKGLYSRTALDFGWCNMARRVLLGGKVGYVPFTAANRRRKALKRNFNSKVNKEATKVMEITDFVNAFTNPRGIGRDNAFKSTRKLIAEDRLQQLKTARANRYLSKVLKRKAK